MSGRPSPRLEPLVLSAAERQVLKVMGAAAEVSELNARCPCRRCVVMTCRRDCVDVLRPRAGLPEVRPGLPRSICPGQRRFTSDPRHQAEGPLSIRPGRPVGLIACTAVGVGVLIGNGHPVELHCGVDAGLIKISGADLSDDVGKLRRCASPACPVRGHLVPAESAAGPGQAALRMPVPVRITCRPGRPTSFHQPGRLLQ